MTTVNNNTAKIEALTKIKAIKEKLDTWNTDEDYDFDDIYSMISKFKLTSNLEKFSAAGLDIVSIADAICYSAVKCKEGAAYGFIPVFITFALSLGEVIIDVENTPGNMIERAIRNHLINEMKTKVATAFSNPAGNKVNDYMECRAVMTAIKLNVNDSYASNVSNLLERTGNEKYLAKFA